MSSDIASKIEQLWARFQKKPNRDRWAESHLSTTLAAQIFSLRESRGWTQATLAKKVGMAQSRISLLEDPSYDKFSTATLKRLASAFDVVFVGRFVSYSEMLEWSSNLTQKKLAPPPFEQDMMPFGQQNLDVKPKLVVQSNEERHGIARAADPGKKRSALDATYNDAQKANYNMPKMNLWGKDAPQAYEGSL